MTLYNCTGFNNGTYNFSIPSTLASGETATITNGVSYGSSGVNLNGSVVQITDSWLSPFTVTSADFVSIDPSAAYGPRNADGSLPVISFMHLAAGSDLIDGGTDVGLPYEGDASDLGAYEWLAGDCVADGTIDAADLECLAVNWLLLDCGVCNGADFDGDHDVNLYDFWSLAENWLREIE